jgi:hypothetical protein
VDSGKRKLNCRTPAEDRQFFLSIQQLAVPFRKCWVEAPTTFALYLKYSKHTGKRDRSPKNLLLVLTTKTKQLPVVTVPVQ